MTHVLRVALYADQNSLVEFKDPNESALVREFRRSFGARVAFTFVTAADVRSGDAFANAPHVFILPGIFGEKSYYPDHIGPKGNAKLRDAIAGGMLLMAYCAGAYYAAQSILYTPAWGKTKKRKSENLAVVAADAFGPLPGYCEPIKEGPENFPLGWHRVDPIGIVLADGQRMEMAYGLGPAFNVESSDIRVVARYDVEGRPAAIIDADFGKGGAILYGALPQFTHHHRPRANNGAPDSLNRLLGSLYEHRHAREQFWNSQMKRVIDHHGMAL